MAVDRSLTPAPESHFDKDHWYVVRVNPQPWEVGPVSVGRVNGKLRGSVGPSLQLQTYQKAIREDLLGQNPVKVEGPAEVKFYIWRHIEEYQTASGRTASANTADATNIQKATEDAIQGILIGNDRYVLAPSSVIMAQDKETDGLILIRVSPARDHSAEIPQHVWDKISAVDEPSSTDVDSQEFIDPESVF